MKTKIYYGRDLIGRFKCDGSKRTWIQQQIYLAGRMYRTCTVIAGIMVIMGYVFTAGVFMAKGTIQPTTLWAKEVIEIPVKEMPPVLKRIAKCESGDIHYKNGQVIFNANTNGSVDIGRYQINTVWNKKATELGLDLSKEKDNEVMAMWIYENRGTEDWYSSKSCWSK